MWKCRLAYLNEYVFLTKWYCLLRESWVLFQDWSWTAKSVLIFVIRTGYLFTFLMYHFHSHRTDVQQQLFSYPLLKIIKSLKSKNSISVLVVWSLILKPNTIGLPKIVLLTRNIDSFSVSACQQ